MLLLQKHLFMNTKKEGVEAFSPLGWNFYYHTNHEGQTFLHKSAADGRVDIIKWAVKRDCDKSSSENNSFWGEAVTLWKRLQTKTWNITNLITQQDNNDNMALHLAASALNEEVIRALVNCPWMDYSSTNSDGDIPLQSFLKALDDSQASYEEKLKEGFKLLVRRETTQTELQPHSATYKVTPLADHQNNDMDSSLHIAANLADPFFYDYLKQFGNTTLKNRQGNTPEQIFESTKQKLQRSTQANDVI